MKMPKVIILVQGGLVSDIESEVPIDVKVHDLDVKQTNTFPVKFISRKAAPCRINWEVRGYCVKGLEPNTAEKPGVCKTCKSEPKKKKRGR